MDEIEQIMAEARKLHDVGKLSDYEVAKLCLRKFQHMLDVGGMEFELDEKHCPACLKYHTECDEHQEVGPTACMLAKAGFCCLYEDSPYYQLDLARLDEDEGECCFTTQVEWFIAFFEKWLEDNPE